MCHFLFHPNCVNLGVLQEEISRMPRGLIKVQNLMSLQKITTLIEDFNL